MYKKASRFLKHTGIRPSGRGIGPAIANVQRPDNRIPNAKRRLHTCHCSPETISRFEELAKSYNVDKAVRLAIRDCMPDLYRAVQRFRANSPMGSFTKQLQAYKRHEAREAKEKHRLYKRYVRNYQ
jgi:hypothetical protein